MRQVTQLCNGENSSFTARVELKDRLKIALDARGMGAGTLERTAGLGNSVVGNLLWGRRTSPRPETLDKIAKALGVSYQWLATGEGPMELAEEPVEDIYPGRADLRRTAYWRTLPADIQGSILRAVVADPEMSLEGWVMLVQGYRTLRRDPPSVSATLEPAPAPAPRRARG